MLPQNPAIAEGLWAATRSYFLKIQWNFTKIGSARSRLYQGIFEFSLRVRRESACISQFLKEKHQNSKKKREKNCNESHDFLMRLLIVKVNKLVWIITRRNRHVPAGDFALHELWHPWRGYEHRWCEGITWQKIWVGWWLDDDCFLTKRSIRTIRVFWVCYARGPDFRAGGKLLFWAGFAYFCLCIVWRVWFCEKRCFGRLRSCSYSWERIQSSFLKVSLMNALVCMQAKKRRLHAVPSCGSDRLKLHFREGSVADISHIRTAYAPREPWNVR